MDTVRDAGSRQQAGETTRGRMKRRGILAAAGAVVAGIAATRASEPVAAAGQALTYEANLPNTYYSNFAKTTVHLGSQIGFSTVFGPYLFYVANQDGAGVTAIYAISSVGTYGVYGISSTAGGCGVRGDCTGGYGVLGTVSDGYGVLGQAVTGNGVRGFSQQNHAVVGQTARPYFGGVVGYATLDQTVGIYGSTKVGAANNANAFAGYMDGNFVVANGVKSAAVPHSDGSHRLVYCMESPENWFEDFGRGTLSGGKAEVRLDPDFMAVVETGQYHVFLTPYDGAGALRAVRLGAAGFGVEEIGGASNGAFSWRVVAKRKDVKAARLAKVDLPGKIKANIKPLDVPQPPPAAKPNDPKR